MKLYNSLSNKKEDLSVNNNTVRIYACGPTVYNLFHIGNARSFIMFDVLRRYLEFKGYNVIFVQNFTDVDDKMINKANDEHITISELAEKYIGEYYKDADGLNIERASFNPRATENIDEIISMISDLVAKGYAYEKNGNVYFRIRAYDGYGQLLKQSLEDLESGARVDVNEEKEDTLDFALWKAYKENEPYWESPWGRGRPGWHIECSAMARKFLGNTIDIHCGGNDLMFPHHENEIAQSECANGCKFARFWFHVGFINVDNQKMSKSKNNFFMTRDLAEKYGYEPLRFFALSAHYRNPINYDTDIIEQAKASLERLYNCADNLDYLYKNSHTDNLKEDEKDIKIIISSFRNKYIESMDDDLNSANGLSVIFDMAKEINKNLNEDNSKELIKFAKDEFMSLNSSLGLLYNQGENSIDAEIERLIEARAQARKEKNFNLADQIRDSLKERGIILEDTKEGVKWKKA